ncbi:hypothetical protein CTAYLR_003510 [Chrysophaeum taylorii]|uniref:RING-type domain-containing protein n=1 Tax=Chrysophaeum taylorii TaxID=2483200 RepID=A0AAD7XJY3_9STRA|nr:hypothetical protein CTAYLR_003510 [Chrysophaeum taylorii]
MDDLISAGTCRLCGGLMVEARTLPCGHAFCESCLGVATRDEYLCPECGVPFFRQDSSKNYALVEFIELLRPPAFKKGDLVWVKRNLRPGTNREGGLARVVSAGSGSFDVAYVVGRARAKNLAAVDLEPYCNEGSTRRTKRIVLTGVSSDAELEEGARIVGGELCGPKGATHVALPDNHTLRRTPKLLVAIATADHVVSVRWLRLAARDGVGPEAASFAVRDKKREREWGFSLPEILADKRLVLEGLGVCVAPNSRPHLPMKDLPDIVTAAGGKIVAESEADVLVDERFFTATDFLKAIITKRLPARFFDTFSEPSLDLEGIYELRAWGDQMRRDAEARWALEEEEDDDDGDRTCLSDDDGPVPVLEDPPPSPSSWLDRLRATTLSSSSQLKRKRESATTTTTTTTTDGWFGQVRQTTIPAIFQRRRRLA